MNAMSVQMDESQGQSKPLAMVTGSTAYRDNVREVTSWEHADLLAAEFDVDPRSIVWGDGTLEWCKSQWGEPQERI